MKSVALEVRKGGLTHPFCAPHFSVTSYLQGNTYYMLNFYIMHTRQEFTHSTFAISDAFRKAVDDLVIEASYLFVLTTICKLEQGERAASSFCPALSLLQSFSSLQPFWMGVQ